MPTLVRSKITGRERRVPDHYLDHPVLGRHWIRITGEAPPDLALLEFSSDAEAPDGNLVPGSLEDPAVNLEGVEDAQDHRG